MKIFTDTSPFIYLIENHPQYTDQIRKYFADLYANNDEIITSVVTYSEFCVKPEKEDKQDLIKEFENFLERFDIPLLDVKKFHANEASQLRAKYKFLKGMDSLQIGTAIMENCDIFLSNDSQLKKLQEIEILLVDQLV